MQRLKDRRSGDMFMVLGGGENEYEMSLERWGQTRQGPIGHDKDFLSSF